MDLKSLFYLHRSDRKVVFLLLLFITGCLGLVIFSGSLTSETAEVKTDSVGGKPSSSFSRRIRMPDFVTEERKHLFPFDPNTATADQLLQLGLAPFQVRNILKYRSKGGIYRSPMDFARLYGLTRRQYRELEPYITIGDDYEPASTLSSRLTLPGKKPTGGLPMRLTKRIRKRTRTSPTGHTTVTHSAIR